MAVAAEISTETHLDFSFWEGQMLAGVPQTVSELELEPDARTKAAAFIGSVLSAATFKVETEQSAVASLLDAIAQAREGSPEARRMLEMNVRTDVIERTIKAGHVMKVEMQVNEQGETMQHGQTGRAIQANSLRFASQNPKMLERTKPEVRNLFRIEQLNQQQILDDYVFVVPSRPADNMSEQEMHDEGFFVDTMSIAFQATTSDGKGNLITESAFVAGKRNRTAPRHDAELVYRLGARLGIDMTGKTASQGIDNPWLIPKYLMPNGVVDLVQLADDEMGGTFFGQDKPRRDYRQYIVECQEREQQLESTVLEIVEELLWANDITTPRQATLALSKISEAKLVRRAVMDERIDTTVFGVQAAFDIQAARYFMEQGDVQKAEEFTLKAEENADSSSCPGGGGKSGGEAESGRSGKKQSGEADGDCDFISKECPLCGAKKVKTTVRKLPNGKTHISGSCGCSKVS